MKVFVWMTKMKIKYENMEIQVVVIACLQWNAPSSTALIL